MSGLLVDERFDGLYGLYGIGVLPVEEVALEAGFE